MATNWWPSKAYRFFASTRTNSVSGASFMAMNSSLTSVPRPVTRATFRNFSGPPYFFAFHKPTVLPSGSCIHAKVPVGISTGGTSIFAPSDWAFARDAATSSTST
jgi:hypothetical protein